MLDAVLKKFPIPKHFDLALYGRGLASLLVVCWHAGWYMRDDRFARRFIVPGRSSVRIFFALSGYLLTFGFKHKKYNFKFQNLKKFYSNRLLRIYPIFASISFISLFLTLYYRHVDLPLNFYFFVKNLLPIQYTHGYVLNGAFWTLGIELQFYIVFPLLIFFQLNKKLFVPIGCYILFCAWLLLFKRFDTDLLNDSRSLLGNLMHFQLGITVCFASETLKKWFKKIKFLSYIAMIALALALMASNKLYRTNNQEFLSYRGIVLIDIVSFCILSLHIFYEERLVKSTLPKFFAILGILSYGMYAWHPVIQENMTTLSNNIPFVLFMSTLLATCTYFLIEKQMLKFKS